VELLNSFLFNLYLHFFLRLLRRNRALEEAKDFFLPVPILSPDQASDLQF
jgi:hypothetical protein